MSSIPISQASRNLSHWVNKAGYSREAVVLTSHGKPKAVILGIEDFETLLGISEYLEQTPIPLEELRQKFREALTQHGYTTRDQIIDLVRDVKKELAAEKFDKSDI